MLALIVNVGSTSLKFKLFRMPDEDLLLHGRIEGIGRPQSQWSITSGTTTQSGTDTISGYAPAIRLLQHHLALCDADQAEPLGFIGFKTVLARHHNSCELLDQAMLTEIEQMNTVAPTHNPPYLQAIRAFSEINPGIPLIGLFEPHFHRTMPEKAWRYPLPVQWADEHGIRRYGFHGASHHWAALRTREILQQDDLRVITCHLGGSSSINATHGVTSLDNSFGFSPQSGLLQSGRPGDLDPAIPVFMMQELAMSATEITRFFNEECGLKGLSGTSPEMRDILDQADQGVARAILARDVFVYQVQKQIGASAAVLNGVDALVFTGGIGERSAVLRSKICETLGYLNIYLDLEKNDSAKPDSIVSPPGSSPILIVAADEERVVARAGYAKLTTS